MVWVCAGFWVWVFLRKRNHQPVLPVAPRRQVPWKGPDLILFFVIYVGSMFAAHAILNFLPGKIYDPPPSDTTSEIASNETPPHHKHKPLTEEKTQSNGKKNEHPIVMLLRSKDPRMLFLCFFMAVIFAPINEEITYRMFIQGYLEKLDWRFRRWSKHPHNPRLESRSSFLSSLPWGMVPILATSAFFAMLHFRKAAEPPPMDLLLRTTLTLMIGGTISLLLLFPWLGIVRKARLVDFGIVPKEIPKDIFRGILGFIAVTVPVYGIQFATAPLVPKEISQDPISIFFLAIAFGVVWCRTHRLIPSIVMHMLFNGFSLTMAMYMLRGGF
jgi:membrane protease YdiL (CAAX protease family)